MRIPKGCKMHECAPKAWRRTPNLSGDYDFDATIMHRSNKDMQKRLHLYLTGDTVFRKPTHGSK